MVTRDSTVYHGNKKGNSTYKLVKCFNSLLRLLDRAHCHKPKPPALISVPVVNYLQSHPKNQKVNHC